tara:strand:+ start:263 stop:514 length:252 start_codon:yes stop_codon:yes gene_type:complete
VGIPPLTNALPLRYLNEEVVATLSFGDSRDKDEIVIDFQTQVVDGHHSNSYELVEVAGIEDKQSSGDEKLIAEQSCFDKGYYD